MKTVCLHILLFLLALGCGQSVQADDLDVIVDRSTTPSERGEAYERLTKVPFESVAAKLLTLIGRTPVLTGINPVDPDHPWLEPRVSEHDRIGMTLHRLWKFYLDNQKTREKRINLMLELLENQSIGSGRSLVALELENCLYWGMRHHDLPPLDKVLPRLEKIARNPKEPNGLRQTIFGILLEQGDPNHYLDDAIALCEEELEKTYGYSETAEVKQMRRSERFRFMVLHHVRGGEKLTPENRAKCLRYGFQELKKIDDGRSGGGYFLAMDLGRLAGVEPMIPGGSPFCPDSRLPKYQGKHGLTESFFQEPVDNALKWWSEHRSSIEQLICPFAEE